MDLKSDVKNARGGRDVEPVWDQGRPPGDETGGAGTSGGGHGITGAYDWLAYAGVAAIAFTIGLVNALSLAQDAARRGSAYDLRTPMLWEMSSVVAVVLATPIVFAAVRRMRATSAWPARAVLGIAAVIAFSSLHIAGMVILRKIALAVGGSSYDFGFSAATLICEFRKDVVTCFLIGGPFWLMESRGDAQAQPAAEILKPATQAADGPHMVWLRDGSTRIRIEPRDILWISSAGNYVEYTLAKGEVHLIRGTLAATETQLKRFNIARVHRTRLANLDRIAGVETRPGGDFELTFDTGQTLIGSRRYRAALEDVERAHRS
jgi:DNA-binding LytR/AlgR family response regulator